MTVAVVECSTPHVSEAQRQKKHPRQARNAGGSLTCLTHSGQRFRDESRIAHNGDFRAKCLIESPAAYVFVGSNATLGFRDKSSPRPGCSLPAMAHPSAVKKI